MVVKSVSLVELKKQQWAKERGKIFCFSPLRPSLRLILFYNYIIEELVKLNGYWRNQNIPVVFNDQRYFMITIFFGFVLLLLLLLSYKYFYLFLLLKIRDHVFYPGIRSNDKDRFSANKDIQSPKNLSFPPISQENQKQKPNVR